MTAAGAAVFRIDGDRAKQVPVALGEVRGDRVTVLSGLAAGETIVDQPADRLRDGDPVSLGETAAVR